MYGSNEQGSTCWNTQDNHCNNIFKELRDIKPFIISMQTSECLMTLLMGLMEVGQHLWKLNTHCTPSFTLTSQSDTPHTFHATFCTGQAVRAREGSRGKASLRLVPECPAVPVYTQLSPSGAHTHFVTSLLSGHHQAD